MARVGVLGQSTNIGPMESESLYTVPNDGTVKFAVVDIHVVLVGYDVGCVVNLNGKPLLNAPTTINTNYVYHPDTRNWSVKCIILGPGDVISWKNTPYGVAQLPTVTVTGIEHTA